MAAPSSSSSSNTLKRFMVASIKRSLVPLIRPAAGSRLNRLKRMTPGGSHAHLPISSLPFFERDYYDRFPLTKSFSGLLLRWTDQYPSRKERRESEWVHTPECLTFYTNLSGWNPEKVNVRIRHHEPGKKHWLDLCICGEADLTFGHVARDRRSGIGVFTLPKKIRNYKISDIKVEIGRNSGELKITLPKQLNGYVKPTVIDDHGYCLKVNATVIDDH